MSRWTLHLRLQQILTLECAIRPLNLLQGGTSPCTPELKWGSRMHVLIEGSLNGLHCCGNETPAANEHRLDCFLGSEWAKAAPQIQSVLLILPPPPNSSASPPPPSVFILLSGNHTAAISHLLINFLRQQITMLFCFCLHLLYSYRNNKVVPATSLVFHNSRVV